MSLVGPRPIIEAEMERCGGLLPCYPMARPGITGLWQVSGRNNVEHSDRILLDVRYVKNCSLWSDIVILFKLVPRRPLNRVHIGQYWSRSWTQ